MASGKQKVVEKNKEIEKRLASVEAVRATRRKIARTHGDFPEINSLIREMREGALPNYK